MRRMVTRWCAGLLALAGSLEWMGPLLMRLVFGYFWIETGWGKLTHLDGFAQRLAGWGTPHPYFNAALSAYTEWIGGILITLGLFTRIASIPLMFNMFVAIVTVKIKQVSTLDDWVEMDELLYILIFFWLMLAGPGTASVDYFIRRALGIDDNPGTSPAVAVTAVARTSTSA